MAVRPKTSIAKVPPNPKSSSPVPFENMADTSAPNPKMLTLAPPEREKLRLVSTEPSTMTWKIPTTSIDPLRKRPSVFNVTEVAKSLNPKKFRSIVAEKPKLSELVTHLQISSTQV